MKRLCFLSPDPIHARQVVHDLKKSGIPEKHIYALAKYGTDMEDLPDAGPESDDFLPAYKRGLELGGITGLLVGLAALAFPPGDITVGGGLTLLLTLWGAGVGGMVGGLVGAALPNSRLHDFEAAIEQGQLLIMADVPKKDVEKYQALVRRLDPAVSVEGIEPPSTLIPA